MWVLMFWVCTTYMCNPTVLPGYYTNKADCEEAKAAIKEADWSIGRTMRIACMKAPDNLGIE